MPEDRLTGAGRTIPVRFVVIPATGPDKAPDPVVWFAGGPDDSAVNDIPGELSSLETSAPTGTWCSSSSAAPASRTR